MTEGDKSVAQNAEEAVKDIWRVGADVGAMSPGHRARDDTGGAIEAEDWRWNKGTKRRSVSRVEGASGMCA